jgi:tRNA (guanine37-N1)-methyltransferase
VTIFPAMVEAVLAAGVVGRAGARGTVTFDVRDLRDYTDDRHRSVDDVAYGGGPGMVMKPEPFARALDAIVAADGPPDAVLLPTPQGRPFRHADAQRFSRLARIAVLCGRYEGVDERVSETLVTDEISVGDFVVSGGELPALVVIDAIVRLVPGVVGDAASVDAESFVRGVLDHPHYTRPAVWRGRGVPEVLLSGHHGEIARWRARERMRRTWTRRPELLPTAALEPDEARALDEIREESRHESD